ncbi:hypothetical protein CVT26_009151 [Gymnopilus dilepis]|uniref:Uncharacterized protein n=1 Tax=Gymnopilus dilepis TaxID=231916 RepID=A0A409Y9D2_9AGAR|nr:hypothetical protein CVT26_009151 [Gymnopilus dilepis]
MSSFCQFADQFLAQIYRCWVVCMRSWRVVVFPIMCWIAGTALSVYVLYIRTRGMLAVGVPTSASLPILASQWATTIALNVYATSVIVYRIYITDRQSKLNSPNISSSLFALSRKRNTQLQRTMRIIIESGLLYTLVSISAFASVIAESNAIFITSAADIMIVGITFNQIIVRLASERARERQEADLQTRLATMRFRTVYEYDEALSSTDAPLEADSGRRSTPDTPEWLGKETHSC